MKHGKSIRHLFFLLAGLIGFSPVFGQGEGQSVFESKCAICHTVGGGKLVGPDLAGVTGRRSEEWLVRFILSSQSMINEGDADAVAVFKEYNETVMPDQPISEAQAKEVLAFIDGGSAGATAEPEVMPDGDTLRGEELFLGIARLENRGPSCNSCHHVNYNEVPAGGAFAKDLTASYANLDEAGVQAILKAPPFPSMRDAYENKELTSQEVADLTAFLGKASRAQGVSPVVDMGNSLLYPGLIAATVLLGFFSLIWMKRRRGTVNKRLFDRQLKSE